MFTRSPWFYLLTILQFYTKNISFVCQYSVLQLYLPLTISLNKLSTLEMQVDAF